MNSNTLQYNSTVNLDLDDSVNPQPSFISKFIAKLTHFVNRSEIERIQAKQNMMQKQAAQAEFNQDINSTLPLEEKLRLGMYRFMN